MTSIVSFLGGYCRSSPRSWASDAGSIAFGVCFSRSDFMLAVSEDSLSTGFIVCFSRSVAMVVSKDATSEWVDGRLDVMAGV